MVYQTSQTLVERYYINLKLQTISIWIWTGVVFICQDFILLVINSPKKKKNVIHYSPWCLV